MTATVVTGEGSGIGSALCRRLASPGSFSDPPRAGAVVKAALGHGESVVLPTRHSNVSIARALDIEAVQAAIRETQSLVPSYICAGFCKKFMAAGCQVHGLNGPETARQVSGGERRKLCLMGLLPRYLSNHVAISPVAKRSSGMRSSW